MGEGLCRVPLAMQFVVQDGVMAVNEDACVWADVPAETLARLLSRIMPEACGEPA